MVDGPEFSVDRLTPEAEREALKAMVQSEGWHIFMAHMNAAWGPAACEAALREAKKLSPPDEWPFESTRILDSFAGMRASVRWPDERIRQLGEATKAASAKLVDTFAKLRRGPQTA